MGSSLYRYFEGAGSCTRHNLIDEYCIKNLESDTVRKYYVESCIKRKKYDTAIRVLTEGKQADKGLPGLVADYSLWGTRGREFCPIM